MSAVRLRNLKKKDAPFMLEWMKDSSIACFFRFDAMHMTVTDCETFIECVQNDKKSIHLAIVDSNDEYLGTISLKNIDTEKKEAEYAISTRKKAHGTGAALIATQKILRIAFEELGLTRVYLNVLQENKRANSFYKKVGFQLDYCEESGFVKDGTTYALNWYHITLPKLKF